MPPRNRSPAARQQAYYPAADIATFKDLLLFEERLKRNAGALKKRKLRYQLHLTLLVLMVLVLLSDVLLETELFILPLNLALSYYFLYMSRWRGEVNREFPPFTTQPYIKNGSLFISGMTLFLFFASGMYREKVEYANKYVPHANRALRQFNMYLNVRTQPLPSRLTRMVSSIGLSFLLSSSSTEEQSTGPIIPPIVTPPRRRTRSLSPSPYPSKENSPVTQVTQLAQAQPYNNPIISSIPPSSNPRGELIFSSRVHAAFREGYERYRDSYERKRQGGRAANASGGGGLNEDGTPVKGVVGRFLTKLRTPFGGDSADVSLAPTPGTETPTGEPGGNPTNNQFGSISSAGGMGTYRGRTISSAGTTPSSSRRSSPGPNSLGSIGKKGSKRKGGRISRQGTPLLEIVENLGTVAASSSAGGTNTNVGAGAGNLRDSPVSFSFGGTSTYEDGRAGTPETPGGMGMRPGIATPTAGEEATVTGFRRRISGKGGRRGSVDGLGRIY